MQQLKKREFEIFGEFEILLCGMRYVIEMERTQQKFEQWQLFSPVDARTRWNVCAVCMLNEIVDFMGSFDLMRTLCVCKCVGF